MARPAVDQHFLARSVYVCEVDDGAVFLDLNHGDYLALDSDSAGRLRGILAGFSDRQCEASADERTENQNCRELVEQLLKRGLITRDEHEGKAATLPRLPAETSMVPVRRGALERRLGVSSVMAFLASFYAVAVGLKIGLLKQLIRKLERPNMTVNHRAPPSMHDIRALVSIYQRLRPWIYTTHEACLPDSLALVYFLRHYGVQTSLVIGVSTKPFSAHAWVQLGDLVLNDCVEHVREYTPILAT